MRQWSIFQRAQRGSCWVSLLPWDGCFADCSSCLLVPQTHPFFASPSLPSCCCCFPYPPRQGPRLKEGGSLVHSMLWQYGGQLSWVSLQDTSYPGTECTLAWRMQSMGGGPSAMGWRGRPVGRGDWHLCLQPKKLSAVAGRGGTQQFVVCALIHMTGPLLLDLGGSAYSQQVSLCLRDGNII